MIDQFLLMLKELNVGIFYIINNFPHSEFLDQILFLFAFIFKPTSIGCMLLTIIIIAQFWKCWQLRKSNSNDLKSEISKFLAMIVSFPLTYLSIELLKTFSEIQRPICILSANSLHFIEKTIILEDIFNKCSSSFPSGHAGVATLIAAFFWSSASSLTRAIFVLIVICTMLSRIMIAFHFPIDVLVGAIIASFSFAFSQKFAKFLIKNESKWTKFLKLKKF